MLPRNLQAPIAALGAYFLWGTLGIYFKAIQSIGPLEIIAHRVWWAMLFLVGCITLTRRWPDVVPLFKSRKTLGLFVVSATVVSINWGSYVYAIVSEQALEASMGYYILPLVAVLFGAIFFKERFSRIQILAVLSAAVGCGYQIWSLGTIPWLALIIAFSFGFYGVIRKQAPADSIVGLFFETLLLTPLALLLMTFWAYEGTLAFPNSSWDLQGLLLLAGPVTAVPLLLFAYAARHMAYSTVGILQYVNPTCQFLLAIFVFKEPFQQDSLIVFGFIWFGVFLYSFDMLKRLKR